MSSGSNREVYICTDDPDMICKKPLDDVHESVQEAEIEAYRNYGEEYEMFCPMDLEDSSAQRIYMKRADVVADSLWERCGEGELDQELSDSLVDEWDEGFFSRDRDSLEEFYDLAKRTCEAIYGDDGKFDGEWLEEEFDKLLGGISGEEAFQHLFGDFHGGNYGFITGPEGKHRIVCIDYAGTW